MQKIIRFFLLLIILFFFSEIRSQNINNRHFSKIIYAEYVSDLPKTMHNNKLGIIFYAEINNNGVMNFLEKDEDNGKEKYFTYRMSDTQLQALDSVFNGETPLNKHLEDTNHIEGVALAGQYDYFSTITNSGKRDEICFVYVYMSEKFKRAINVLEDIFDKNEADKTTAILPIPPQVQASILKLHKKSKYLPLISPFPPPADQ